MAAKAFEPFKLPNGKVLKNRIAKAALQEKMADVGKHNQPSESLLRLYQAWGAGGAGLILSGNIMIDPMALSAPGDILLAEDAGQFDEALWRTWIDTTQRDGAQFWLQLNHPGRQIMKGSGLPTYAPSEVTMEVGMLSGLFEKPREMTEDHIQDVIRRFAWTAHKAEELGCGGVQIHAAHGYLISQFLSPITNKRTDRWGGPLENRARLLYEIVRAVRASVSSQFGFAVKINTADFQRGGFEAEDFKQVFTRLNDMQLDFIEVSGGNFESPVMATGETGLNPTSTFQREAYFLQAAESVKDLGHLPIMVTGGIRMRRTCDAVLQSSDRYIAGIGTALGLVPDLPNRWKAGEDPTPTVPGSWILSGHFLSGGMVAQVQYNLKHFGTGSKTMANIWPVMAIIIALLQDRPQMKAYKKWIGQRVKITNT